MSHYTIYNSPSDYPGKYVVREWVITGAPEPEVGRIVVCDSLEAARREVPPEFISVGRDKDDSAPIVGTWI